MGVFCPACGALVTQGVVGLKSICAHKTQHSLLNPVALRMAKTPQSFSHSECRRVNVPIMDIPRAVV